MKPSLHLATALTLFALAAGTAGAIEFPRPGPGGFDPGKAPCQPNCGGPSGRPALPDGATPPANRGPMGGARRGLPPDGVKPPGNGARPPGGGRRGPPPHG